MICQVIQTEMCGYHNYTLDHGSYMLPVAEQLCSTNHDSPYIEHRQTDQTILAMATEFHPLISEPLTGPEVISYVTQTEQSPAQAYFCSV